jgi:hypothetical protein
MSTAPARPVGIARVAHRSFLSTGKGENRIDGGVLRLGEGSGGRRRSCVGVEGERKLGSTIHGEKAVRGGGVSWLRSPWRSSRRRRRPDSGGGALGQQCGRLRTWETARSGWARVRRGDGTAQTAERRCRSTPLWHDAGTCAVRRGRMAATRRRRTDRWARRGKRRLTGGPLMSVISKLNLLLDENSSK